MAAFMGFLGALVGAAIGVLGNVLISKKSRSDKFKLAALEKRLDIHQKAYTYMLKLNFSLFRDAGKVVEDCQNWWYENCLYLDYVSRESFFRAYISAANYKDMPLEERKQIDAKVKKALEDIEHGVDLPPMGIPENLKSVC